MVYDPSTHRMIMFGGWIDGTNLNDTWAYDLIANTWTELSPLGTQPYARNAHAAVYAPSNGLVIMFGGVLSGHATFLNDTWAYDPSANTWTKLAPSGTLPSERHDQAMVYDPSGNRMIMFGGVTSSSRLNDTWVYTP